MFGGGDAIALGCMPAPGWAEEIEDSLFLLLPQVNHEIIRHGSLFLLAV
jgi:hypothetical protein